MLKTRWETIRDDVAGMLADGVPLEDITGKLEKLKNEYQKPLTNEEWLCGLSTEEKARFFACEFTIACDDYAYFHNKETWNEKYWLEWLKEKHDDSVQG